MIKSIGSQNREPLADIADEYQFVGLNGTELILLNISSGRRELWTLNDHYAGYVIEYNGKGYEFVRSNSV